MCCKNRGPRCSTCHKSAPYHRCRCPAKYASAQTDTARRDGLPIYSAVIDPQPPTSTLLPISTQSRCGGRNYGGYGYRKRHCRGPIRLLVGLVIRKIREKKERDSLTINFSDEREGGVQERGVVETVDEKQAEAKKMKEEGEEEKEKDVKVLTKSVRSMSL